MGHQALAFSGRNNGQRKMIRGWHHANALPTELWRDKWQRLLRTPEGLRVFLECFRGNELRHMLGTLGAKVTHGKPYPETVINDTFYLALALAIVRKRATRWQQEFSWAVEFFQAYAQTYAGSEDYSQKADQVRVEAEKWINGAGCHSSVEVAVNELLAVLPGF